MPSAPRGSGRRTRGTRSRLTTLSATALLLIAACSAAGRSASAGPLESLSDGSTLCLYAPTSLPVTDAQDILDRTRPGAVTLRSISLVDPRNVTVSGPALLPLSAGSPLIGGAFPPVSTAFAPVDWRKHVEVDQLSPVRGSLTIVFGVALSGPTGSAAGTRVIYSVGGRDYTVTSTTRLTMSRRRC